MSERNEKYEVWSVQPPRVRLQCGCITDVVGGWIGTVRITQIVVLCPNGHDWQNIKEEVKL